MTDSPRLPLKQRVFASLDAGAHGASAHAPSTLNPLFSLPLEFAPDARGPELAGDVYLRGILEREAVDIGNESPVRGVQAVLMPLLGRWAGSSLVAVHPSGSFLKGTANRSATDIDLFISLHWTTEATLRAIYDGLDKVLRAAGYAVRRQNVSLHVKVRGFEVDLVPAKRQNAETADHSLYLRRRDTWIKTNVMKHVAWVLDINRQDEMRLMKLWRDQRGLDWPSFYVELMVARALEGAPRATLWGNLRTALEFARDHLEGARLVDPANGNNVVSDSLTQEEKRLVSRAAAAALKEMDWRRVVA